MRAWIPRRVRKTAMLALFSLAASGAAGHAQGSASEAAVKATYLYKFAPFVEWPASAFPSQSSPFYLCVLGDDSFGTVLNQAVSGQKVDGRPMAVRRLRSVDAGTGCHILYLGDRADKSATATLKSLKGAPVLTVSDQGRIQGAVIRFIVKGGRVRFAIDTAAASTNRVTISSKLLSLALSVRPGP